MNKTVDYLNECETFFLATIDGNQPKVRPFGATMEIEGRVYFCTGKTKDVYKQLILNPRVEISGISPKRGWIRITARIAVDDREKTKKTMLDTIPSLKSIYATKLNEFALFYLKEYESVVYEGGNIVQLESNI